MSNFNFSSSPASLLYPNYQYSQFIGPNFTGIYGDQLGALGQNYANNLAQKGQNLVNQTAVDVGLTLSQSDNAGTAFQGKQMVDGAIKRVGGSSVTPTKPSFSDKFANSTFGKNYGVWSAALDTANNLVTSIAGEKDEYSGDKGNVTRSMDQVYDAVQGIAGMIPGVGQAASLIMGANKFLGNVANKLGGGTDGMTTTDAILGSSFFQMTPLGLINGFGGKNADTITRNDQAFEVVGSSYTGTNQTVNDALTKSGKKYGLLSSGARRDANGEIQEAKRQQSLIEDIGDEATDRRNIQYAMAAINGNRRRYQLQGGYNQANVRVGRSGMSLELIAKAKKILSEPRKLQTGGTAKDPFEYYLSTLPVAQRDSSDFRVRDYWLYNGKPKDFDEAKKKGMFSFNQKDNSYHARSVAENPQTGDIEFMKSSNHPTIFMETDWYEKGLIHNDDGATVQLRPGIEGYEDWQDFKNNYELQKTDPYWKYVRRKKDTPSHKEGGQIQVKPTEIILVEPELESSIDVFKEGGSINVIPEGALHARKHNMDLEGITEKGIPVIDNDGEQQAEIEREELIIRLEVTKKLEELEKKFYDSETSQKEKDECALEAGKLLVEEILYNTQDNTKSLL